MPIPPHPTFSLNAWYAAAWDHEVKLSGIEAPCTVAIDVGVAKAGMGAMPSDGHASDRSQGVNGFVLNTVTPSTDKTCLYFWAFCRNYLLGEQKITTELREGVARVFGEDEVILEAQQRAIDAHPGYRFSNLNIDAGSMWARRLIDRQLAAEERLAAPVMPMVPIRAA